jgi:1,4-dihydroxy-2-naphthoyl-CoA hydrolase
VADPPTSGTGAIRGHGPLGFEPLVPYERSFDALYGLEAVGEGLGEDGILRGRVRVRPELLGAEDRLHGGVPAAIAEALASQGTAMVTIGQGMVPSGLSNDTTVIAAAREETTLHAEATPLSRVEDYWVWSVQLRDDAGTLCAFSRVTIAVRPLRR